METWPIPSLLLPKQTKWSATQPKFPTVNASHATALQHSLWFQVPQDLEKNFVICTSSCQWTWRGSSIRITSCEALVPIPCITLVLNCCSILTHPNHVCISQLFVPHTAASSCHSDPPPKIFLPPCVKSSPSLLPSTRFQSVFKVHFSWEMDLVHQAGQEK